MSEGERESLFQEEGTVKGARRSGRYKEAVGRRRQRVDGTGLDFPESQRAVEDGQTEMEAAGQRVDRAGFSRVTEGLWKTERGGSWSDSGQGWIFQSHRGAVEDRQM